MPHKDMLQEMFRLQEQLNERIGVRPKSMNEADQQTWVLNYARAMSQELAELVDSVPWKWWARYQTFDKQNARIEVVDLFHFLISLAEVLGMTPEDVFRVYAQKHKVNLDRQDSGYHVKDESDNRTIEA
jgi:dimeric dUTPase (all-alpha-NTP-PPase superfamily)